MAADMNDMVKFFIKLYQETADPGKLTKRSLRDKYLEHAGLDKLTDQQELAFKAASLKAYEEYDQSNAETDSEEEFEKKPESKKRKLSKKESPKASKKRAKKNEDSDDESEDEFVRKNVKNTQKKDSARKPAKPSKKAAAKKADSSSEDQPKPPEAPEDESSSDGESLVNIKTPNKLEKPEKSGSPKATEKENKELQSSDSDEDDERQPEKMFSSESDAETKKPVLPKKNGSSKDKIKKLKQATKTSRSTKESSDDKDDTEVEKMKAFVRAAGIRIPKYSAYFEGCSDTNSKVKKLEATLREAGLAGRITMAACKKLKKEREEEREVSELDTANIIDSSAGRSRRSQVPKRAPKRSKVAETASPSSDEGRNPFANLKGIVDSDSESS